MSDKDGGPAFPFPAPVWMKPRDADGPITRLPDSVQPGMTLKDYFAAHAPDIPKGWWKGDNREPILDRMVMWRWAYARAMLADRKPE